MHDMTKVYEFSAVAVVIVALAVVSAPEGCRRDSHRFERNACLDRMERVGTLEEACMGDASTSSCSACPLYRLSSGRFFCTTHGVQAPPEELALASPADQLVALGEGDETLRREASRRPLPMLRNMAARARIERRRRTNGFLWYCVSAFVILCAFAAAHGRQDLAREIRVHVVSCSTCRNPWYSRTTFLSWYR